MKAPREIRVAIDGEEYLSRVFPISVKDFDTYCVACGSGRVYELLNIVQQGFYYDDVVTLMHCPACRETFHFHYELLRDEDWLSSDFWIRR